MLPSSPATDSLMQPGQYQQELSQKPVGSLLQKDPSSSSQSQPISANASRQVTPSTPTGKGNLGAKLVLAQNNPHLKSHRRRQSAQAAIIKSRDTSQVFAASPEKTRRRGLSNESSELEKDILQGFQGGLEHNRQLADSLFDRWCEGLRVRWPAL